MQRAAAGSSGQQRAAAGSSGQQRAAAGSSGQQRAAAGSSGQQRAAAGSSGQQRAAAWERFRIKTCVVETRALTITVFIFTTILVIQLFLNISHR